ncbi:MAG: hypothetical protein EZS28_009948 [Streblomastix strix]|uniref:Tyr recombinase domain-containing protein n=1 Tax=Streblomastix strix TaxID=222440 RepID=A0A5J4WJN5_9EUKA|nr:MAG: hypothetical protein EZS28_009948 [Streblomastix strix]
MGEMAIIDPLLSIIDDEEHTATVCIPQKQSRKRERYDVSRTNDPKMFPAQTFFVLLERLGDHFQHSPTNFLNLFWTENWKQADQKYISIRLERLVQTLGINGATVNIIRHASSTELAARGFDGMKINIFAHHTSKSKTNQQFYIFTINMEQDFIASSLVKNHGEKQTTQIISKQRGGSRVSEGDGLQQSLLGDDLQLSPQEILASPLSIQIISTQPIVEAESLNDHKSSKRQKSQMWKDDQDVEPQEEAQDSSMTKDSDRATCIQKTPNNFIIFTTIKQLIFIIKYISSQQSESDYG